MRLEMFGVGDQDARLDNADQGFRGQITSLFADESLEAGSEGVVLVVLGADIVVNRVGFLLSKIRHGRAR